MRFKLTNTKRILMDKKWLNEQAQPQVLYHSTET